MSASGIYLGLISGTSVDAIDAALVRFDGQPECLAARSFPWPETLRNEVLAVSQSDAAIAIDRLSTLDVEIGRVFASAAAQLLATAGIERAQVCALGSHGQTIRHRPRAPIPYTLQLGDPNVIAEQTGITTVGDFRRRDVAAGGEGAPLVPAFHASCLSSTTESRAVLNLGGIANLTFLDPGQAVRGHDTGPANALLDAHCRRAFGIAHDAGGSIAARGTVDPALLAAMLGDPYFRAPAPKSSGRDYFNLHWLEQFAQLGAVQDADLLATLSELTAATVADAVLRDQPRTDRLLVCGGGVHNSDLLARLRRRLAPRSVESTAAHGIDPDFVEAMAFAWLARETLAGRAGNLPAVTGARGPRVLGAIYPA